MGQPQHDMSLVKFQTDLELVVSNQVLVRESEPWWTPISR